MNNRVAIFTFCGYDVINSPMIHSAEYLASQGYAVDVFARNPSGFDTLSFSSSAIRYHITAIRQTRIGYRTGRLRLLKNAWQIMRRHRYDFVIGFDPVAFQHAWLLSRIFRVPAVYHSLEFYSYDTLKQRIHRLIEFFFLRHADWMITQDGMRADWLNRKFGFPREKISLVYNAAYGETLSGKSRYLRKKFRIPDDKKIVLAVGSLTKAHMILELASSVVRWPQEFVLVIHGWFLGKPFEEQVRAVVAEQPGRIFISTEFLPQDRKYEVFQSADIGLVTFTPDIENTQLVGAAAGKLFEFVRCGVPVMVNELAGMRNMISGHCGEVCSSRLEDIERMLARIDHGYAQYAESCRSFYKKFGFAESYRVFLDDFYALLQNLSRRGKVDTVNNKP